jgi:trafficking protein particle complex subunit 9
MPTIFKSRGFFYTENNPCSNLETRITDYVHSLFWILESKRLERTKEKFDKVALILAPFEKKDFVGLDMESRVNKKRIMGRVTKNLADLTLQCGLIAESLNYYFAAAETLKSIGDSLWYGAALEGICAGSSCILYPHMRHSTTFQRGTSLQGNVNHISTSPQKNLHRASDGSKQMLQNRKLDLKISLDRYSSKDSSPTSSSESSNSTSNPSSDNSVTSNSSGDNSENSKPLHQVIPSNMLQPDDISPKYREAIINYSKYRMAGIIETEAALKAARICIEQNKYLDVAMFLQNVLYINLNMNEQERVRRFETLTELYQQIGYHRKASFCQRLAAWRHIAQSNTNPDWSASYRLMLESFRGHKLSLEPTEVLMNNQGWPCLQIDLLQALVGTARRLGLSALATRHMTFLLQTQWKNLSPQEQKEMSLQLQSLSAQCEGSPVPLFLENGNVIPPANLTDLPYCSSFQLKELPQHLRPIKLETNKVDCGPFLFTPIHFNASIDRRSAKSKKLDSKINFLWVYGTKSEVIVKFLNPLPFDLQVNDMRLLSDGIVFESIPESVTLAPNSCSTVSLYGTPLEVGELEMNGYSTHTLGVKSNCRLKSMRDRDFPVNFQINVVSALPLIDIKTSYPQSTMSNPESVICSAKVTLYNGETQKFKITITNTSDIEINYIEVETQSSLDSKTQKRILKFDSDDLKNNLPLMPGKSFDLSAEIYGDAEFIGSSPIPPNLSPHQGTTDGPSSLSGVNSLMSGGTQSLPSRVSSPIRRNNEQNSSFRSSTTTASGTANSGHSSLATLSLGTLINNGNQARFLDLQLKFKYSGGNAQVEGYCRQCSLLLNLEMLPSIQVTNWDVLPAEV